MVRRVLLRLFPTSSTATLLRLSALVGLCLGLASVLPALASAASYTPVAEYSFDEIKTEGETETVEDLSGDNHTATVEGATSIRGKYGAGLKFDGENSCVSIPESESLQMTEEFALEAWVRPEGEGLHAVITQEDESAAEGEDPFAYTLLSGDEEHEGPRIWVRHPGGARGVAGGPPVPQGAWSHLAVTDDGANLRFYVDGELTDTRPAVPLTTGKGPLTIGCIDLYGDHFKGRIDEVRVYDRAISGSEIAADMETPLQTPKSGPVADYSFDEVNAEGEGETVADLSGHEHTGTIEGATAAPGKYGASLKFDGENDCVSIESSPELELTEEFALEAWVRPEGEGLDGVVTQEDESAAVGEDPFAYTLLSGDEEHEGPRIWVRHPGGERGYAGGPTIPEKAWSHLAVTDDGAHLRFYVDGELTDTEPAVPLTTGKGPLTIGCIDLYGDHFKGRVDEVRVYDRAITGAEVAADMEAPIQTPKAGPVAAYSFDEGKEGDETVQDVTGDGHTATIEDGTWINGRYGGGIGFGGGGGNSCVSVPDSPELRLSEEFTLEAWVRPLGGVYEDPVVVREAGGKDAFGLGLGSRVEYAAEGFIGQGKYSKAAVGGEVRENEWTPIATTYDGSTIRVYEEGVLVDEEFAPTPPVTGEGPLKIGCDGPDGQFTGGIDEVRVYNRALTGTEVATTAEAPLQTPKTTPVASYSFDENNEVTQADTSGDGHTATVEGAKWTEHGRYGGAMEFDAAEGDVLKIPASSQLNFSEAFTLEAWVRPSGEDNHSAPLIDKQEGSGNGYFLYEGGSVSDRPVGAASEEQEHIHADDPLPAKSWSHVALVFTGGRTYLYVDGELIDNGAAEPIVTEEGELQIGGSTDTSDYFDGRVDEVRIYNRPLNPAEVGADMEAPIQTPKQGPIAAWSFDEIGEGGTVEDLTGDGHTATIEGAVAARGKYGEALQFDGENDVVKVPNSPEFALTEGFTLESWVRPESSSSKWAPILAKAIGGGKAAHELAWWLYESGHEPNVPYGGTESASGEKNEALGEDPLPVNAWSHVALTYNGSQVALYVNGELVDCSEAPSEPPRVTEGELQIGGAIEHGAYFKGRLDEVRIYNRPLSAAEVKASMAPSPEAATTETIGVEEGEGVMIGTIDTHGLPTEYQFEYGPTQSYGMTVPEFDEEELVSDQPEEVEEVAEELQPETTYHYRVVATNAAGRAVGADQTFTTGPEELQPEALGAEKEEKKYPGFANMMWSGNFAKMGTKSVMNDVEGSGARMLRLLIPGLDAEGHNPEIEKIFRLAAEANITILPYITQGLYEPKNPEWSAGWVSKVKGVVERFGQGGSFWSDNPTLPNKAPEWLEVWNEENYGPFNGNGDRLAEPKEFGEVLQLAHEAIGAITPTGQQPKAKILVGGLLSLKRSEEEEKTVKGEPKAHTPLMAPGSFIRQMGHVADYDAVAVHPYAFAVKGKTRPKDATGVNELTIKVKKNLKKVRAAMDSIAKKEEGTTYRERPIWVTEIGFPVHTASDKEAEDGHHLLVSEEVQGELLTHVFNMMKNRSVPESQHGFDISRAFYYNVQDFVDNHHTSWDYRCGLREDDAGNYVVLNSNNEPVKGPDGKPKEAPTREKHQYRPAFFAFEKEAEITGKYP